MPTALLPQRVNIDPCNRWRHNALKPADQAGEADLVFVASTAPNIRDEERQAAGPGSQ